MKLYVSHGSTDGMAYAKFHHKQINDIGFIVIDGLVANWLNEVYALDRWSGIFAQLHGSTWLKWVN